MASLVIDIDVGGTKVRTTTSTLKQVPFLEALLRHEAAGTMNVTKTDDGIIFIDRSPELFIKVMEGLRTGGQIFADSASEASQLLEELAFLGLHASCPKLNAWKNSAIEQLFVKWGTTSGDKLLLVGATQEVLKEVAPVLGYGGSIIDQCRDRQLMLFDLSMHQFNTSLGEVGSIYFAFRLSTLLGEFGFEEKIHFGKPAGGYGHMMFTREKLYQRDQPFIIDIEFSEQFKATCGGPFQVGVNVLAHSLGTADLNGAEGTVVGHQGDRVVVKFRPPIGEKALKQKNLMLTAASSGGASAATIDAASVQCMDGGASGDTGSLVDVGQPSTEHGSDAVHASAVLLADNQKTEAVEPDLQEAIQQSEQEALQKEQADVAQAIFESTFEAPDGVVLRLTHHHHDPEVREALMTSEALGDSRKRVTEAGCELLPVWGNGALFLLPFREQSNYEELQLQGIRLEDLKPYNIVALRNDEDLVKQALAQVPRRRRPQCKREGPGPSTSPGKPSGECLETGAMSDSVPGFLSDIRVEIERTFFTVRDVQASRDSRTCRSAPGPW